MTNPTSNEAPKQDGSNFLKGLFIDIDDFGNPSTNNKINEQQLESLINRRLSTMLSGLTEEAEGFLDYADEQGDRAHVEAVPVSVIEQKRKELS